MRRHSFKIVFAFVTDCSSPAHLGSFLLSGPQAICQMRLLPQLPVTFSCPFSSSLWIIFNALIIPLLPPYFFLHHSLYVPSFLPQATPFLQSHPALWDEENTEDQFCSVTFGGGLQSKGMVGELELREIYSGCLREKEISYCEHSPEEKKKKEKKGLFELSEGIFWHYLYITILRIISQNNQKKRTNKSKPFLFIFASMYTTLSFVQICLLDTNSKVLQNIAT